jgi:DNA-3-methyladenine glycosylase
MGRADALKPGRRKDEYLPLARSELPIDTVSLARYLIGTVLVRKLPEGVPIMRLNRGIERLRDLARGPGRLTAALRVDRWLDGLDLN